MTVKTADDYFSSSSSASAKLATELRTVQNDGIDRSIRRYYRIYIHGLDQICRLDPPRDDVILLWHKYHLDKAVNGLKPSFERYNLSFQLYENLLIHKMRQAILNGKLLEKMRM
jgi:hypothetical protein